MVVIALINQYSRLNKGNSALFKCMVQFLNDEIANSKFIVYSFNPKVDNKLKDGIDITYYESPIRFVRSKMLNNTRNFISVIFLRYNIKLFAKKELVELSKADVIISNGGDILTEDYSYFSLIDHLLTIYLGVLLRKPVVILAETIGPFNKRSSIFFAKFVLNRVSLITLRDEISLHNLEKLKINKPPIYLTADLAFLLDPAPGEKIEEIMEKENIRPDSKPMIGLAVSKIISRYGFPEIAQSADKYDRYIDVMAKTVDHIVEKYNATIVFIPHVIQPGSDDRVAIRDIMGNVKNKEMCKPIYGDYTDEELKGLIGKCDAFIGARMHSTIASTSMNVPTVAIAYSQKMYGVIGKMIGQEKYVIDIKKLNYEVLSSTFDSVYEKREEIKADLMSKGGKARSSALLNIDLVKGLLETEHSKNAN